MPSSPWDLPLLSNFNYCNLHCFLESVTPIVSTTLLPKDNTINDSECMIGFFPQFDIPECCHHARFQMRNGFPHSIGKDTVECFCLNDLWNFYVAKSAYGAAVPLLLNDGESVVQYYSPSLSAIQLYTRKPLVSFRFDSGSWNCEDSENDKVSMSMSNNSSRTSDATSDDNIIDHEGPCQTMNRLGHLYCQFNETLGPYERVPLTVKINELAKDYIGLNKFKSTDLSPYSWMAIAWYPIYQIPSTRGVKELSACFLTYHKLSSYFQAGLRSAIPEEEEEEDYKFQCNSSLGKKYGDGISSKGEVSLLPFALATYKMYGDLWMNPETPDHKERIISYQNAAHSWLKQLGFQHNDFNFFISRT